MSWRPGTPPASTERHKGHKGKGWTEEVRQLEVTLGSDSKSMTMLITEFLLTD